MSNFQNELKLHLFEAFFTSQTSLTWINNLGISLAKISEQYLQSGSSLSETTSIIARNEISKLSDGDHNLWVIEQLLTKKDCDSQRFLKKLSLDGMSSTSIQLISLARELQHQNIVWGDVFDSINNIRTLEEMQIHSIADTLRTHGWLDEAYAYLHDKLISAGYSEEIANDFIRQSKEIIH